MAQRLYFDLLPRELTEELLLYIPMDQTVQDWFDSRVIVISATGPFWKSKYVLDYGKSNFTELSNIKTVNIIQNSNNSVSKMKIVVNMKCSI